MVAKTTIVVDGNVVTQTQKISGGRVVTVKREFSDDTLKAVIKKGSSTPTDLSPGSLEGNYIKMSYLGKEYKYVKHEKFDEFLKALGLPQDRVDAVLSHASSQTMVKNGDTYTLTLNGHDGVKTLSFKSGVEFDEKVGNFDAKTTFVVNGNVVEQTQKFPDGRSISFRKEFSDDKIVVAATNSSWDGVAYRYYSA